MKLKQWVLMGVVVILLGLGIKLTYDYTQEQIKKEDKKPEIVTKTERDFNFIETGYLLKDNPGLKENTWYLSYEKPGSAGLSKELLFDKDSLCLDENNQNPCLLISNISPGMKVKVSGNEEDGMVTVAFMGFIKESTPTESKYIEINWTTAKNYINTCMIQSAAQSHSKTVYLTLKDGRMLKTVEPNIDEIMTVVENVKVKCGEVRIATE